MTFPFRLFSSRKERRLVSIVALLPERTRIGEGDVQAAVERAGIEAGAVGGEGPVCIVPVDGLLLVVTSRDEPYGDAEHVPEDAPEELKPDIASHQAAILVDQVGDEPSDDERERAYRLIGSLVAELAPAGCVIYWPDKNRFARMTTEAAEQLRGEAPLLIFATSDREDVV